MTYDNSIAAACTHVVQAADAPHNDRTEKDTRPEGRVPGCF
jgi:hypothetical protein